MDFELSAHPAGSRGLLDSMGLKQWFRHCRHALTFEILHPLPWHARFLLRAWVLFFAFTADLEGQEILDSLPEPVIFAFNHNNSSEVIVVPATLIYRRHGRLLTFMVDWMYTKIPILGHLMRYVKPVPVYSKPARWKIGESYRQAHKHLSVVELCKQRLEEEEMSVGIFPEGTRNRDPDKLLRARTGLGYLVLACDVPVVPIGIDFPSKQRTGRIPSFGHIVVRVGEPLDFSAERAAFRGPPKDHNLDDEGHKKRARRHARAIVDRVMRALEPLCNKRYPYDT